MAAGRGRAALHQQEPTAHKKAGQSHEADPARIELHSGPSLRLRSVLRMDASDTSTPRADAVDVHAATPCSSSVLRVRARIVGCRRRVVAPPAAVVLVVPATDDARVDEATDVANSVRVIELLWRGVELI